MDRPEPGRLSRFVWIVLVIALVLRVGVMLVAFTSTDTYTGDGPYYIKNARQPWRLGIPDPLSQPRWQAAARSIGPVYPAFLIPFFNLIPDEDAVGQLVAARVGQAAVDALTVLLVYLIARRLFGERAGRVALVAQAVDLRYVFAAGAIATETLFVALMAACMLFYIRASTSLKAGPYRLAGLMLGLALLTRPVPLLFPALLVAHAALRPSDRGRALGGVAWLIVIAGLVTAPWLVRTAALTDEFTPITNTFYVHLWRGTREDAAELSTSERMEEAAEEEVGEPVPVDPEVNPEDIDFMERREGSQYLGAALHNIRQAPFAWGWRQARATVGAYLQPYGTVILTPRGAGVKQAAADFLRGEASLWAVLSVPGLWRRLLMHVSHYWGLVLGVAGFVLALRAGQGWEIAPLAGWIVYVTGVTAPLLVEPRYLFPAMFAFTVLAAYGTVRAWDALKAHGGFSALIPRLREG
jgi:4-amino-4-deoxy-L-arabinose transferase-like glycosyltransferase